MFRWLKQEFKWPPKFLWHDEIYGNPGMVISCLHMMDENDRCYTLQSCRELFENLKAAGVPIKLLMEAVRPFTLHPMGNNGTFFVHDWMVRSGEGLDTTWKVDPR